jgi:hypothetical protein
VAVRCRRREDLESELASGAGPIVDDDGLSEGVGELQCEAAGHGIHAAAWRKGHQDPNRMGRELLSVQL